MVRARIHIICGNCGSNDMLKWNLFENYNDDTGETDLTPSIHCGNCSTIHFIDECMDKKVDAKEVEGE